MKKSIGQIACEAFLPPEHQKDEKLSWDNLDPILQDHWEDAALAVIHAYNSLTLATKNEVEL